MRKIILTLLFKILLSTHGWSQGCTPIRNITGLTPDVQFRSIQSSNKYLLNISNKYFKASSTYKGTKYITDTLVTNRIFNLNISLSGLLTNGWSMSLIVPVSANSRQNSADHGGPKTPKHTTHSFGLGDIRFSVNKWILNSTANQKWNVQIGLGIKLPTGDFRYQDYFFRNDSTKVLAPVDPAIQLGDGGTGITTEVYAFYSFVKTVHVFMSGYHLMNPREQNGISNLKGRNPSSIEIINNTTVMSVPDQYTLRGGINLEFQQIIFTAALRYEKLPVKDLVGGNKGFRRATSVASLEPGITYQAKKLTAFGFVGMPFKRNIIQNQENNMTPAGFADYLFSFGVQFEL